jgi:16S rRNA (adenine1518-N6/adenine1519-N6)-dimethyltransferase
MPAPNVDSAVIRLSLRETPPVQVKDEALLFRLIRSAFGQRRKTLANALQTAGFSKSDILTALEKAKIPATARAEQLSLQQFADLTNAF